LPPFARGELLSTDDGLAQPSTLHFGSAKNWSFAAPTVRCRKTIAAQEVEVRFG
jgi:hypothetical protein